MTPLSSITEGGASDQPATPAAASTQENGADHQQRADRIPTAETRCAAQCLLSSDQIETSCTVININRGGICLENHDQADLRIGESYLITLQDVLTQQATTVSAVLRWKEQRTSSLLAGLAFSFSAAASEQALLHYLTSRREQADQLTGLTWLGSPASESA